MFDSIIGNLQVKEYLTRVLERNRLGNSLLLAGPEGIGKSLFALKIAQRLLSSNSLRNSNFTDHPDLHVYHPEGKIGMHTIAAMRQFSEEVYMAPFEAKWKVFIIHDADRMLSYSANALLKTFEEPATDAVIILLSSSPKSLLPTILSRCRTINFLPLETEEIASYLQHHRNVSHEESQRLAWLARGSLGNAIRLHEEGENPLRPLLLKFLASGGTSRYKDLSAAVSEIAEQMDETKKNLEEELRSDLLKLAGGNLSAAQKQSIEKEVEGAVSIHALQRATSLFEIILLWYRDMQLMHVQGNEAYLLHPDFQQECRTALKNGKLLPLDKVQKIVSETTLMLERSTSFQICLENLFLKLNYI